MTQQGAKRGCLLMNLVLSDRMSYKIEICANSVQSALNAEQGGADRVELCDNLWEGGTTPSHATIKLAKRYLSIPVFVLIRPRGGDFVYTDVEFETIRGDIEIAKDLGVDGIVSGVLLPDGKIDVARTKELVKLSSPLPFTFHRAFDHVIDVPQGVTDLINCGVTRLLTSGQKNTAIDGLEKLKEIMSLAGDRLIILPGGGINKDNIRQLFEAGCQEFHFSAKTQKKGLSRHKGSVLMNGSKDIPEDTIQVSDPDLIQVIKAKLNEKL